MLRGRQPPQHALSPQDNDKGIKNKMKSNNIVYLFNRENPHTHTAQIEIGLLMLRRQHLRDFEIESIPYDSDRFPTPHLVLAQFDGVRFAFDLLDGYNMSLTFLERFLPEVDVYYKRKRNTPARFAV